MRPRARAAHGTALLYVLTTATAHACPVAADLDGAGIRLVGASGEDEIHRRLDPARVQIGFVIAGTIGSSRSMMIHGVYLQWLGGINADGSVGDGTVT